MPGTVRVQKYALAMHVRWYQAQPFNTTVHIQSESKGKSVPLFLHVCFTVRGVMPSMAAPETAGLGISLPRLI